MSFPIYYIFHIISFCCFDTEGAGEINSEGVEYYSNLINYSLEQGNFSISCHGKYISKDEIKRSSIEKKILLGY